MGGIFEEIGFAGALIVRETPEGFEIIDGHLRADMSGDELVPIIVVDLSEEEADKLLAVLDPIGAMAETDTEALDELLRGVSTGSDALMELMSELGGSVYDIEETEAPELEDTEREPYQHISFVLHDDQVARLKEAIAKAKELPPLEDSPSKNANSNALAMIVEAFLDG